MLELQDNDISLLLEELQALGNYERIVVDTNHNLHSRLKVLARFAYRLCMVAEQSEIGMKKLEAVSQTVLLMERNKQIDVSTKLMIICNKANDRKQVSYGGQIPIKEFIAYCSGNTSKQVVEQLTGLPVLEGRRGTI